MSIALSAPATPLAGRRIVVTRPRRQAGALLDALAQLGAEAVPLPLIETVPPEDPRPLDAALRRLDQYQGIIFTSANGVEAFFERAAALGFSPSPPAGWLCAIGPETARQLERRGWPPAILPQRYVAEGILDALAGRSLQNARILIPRAAEARDVLPRELARAGALPEIVAAYRTRIPAGAAALAPELFPVPPASPPADAALFTSSSTVRHLAALLGSDYSRRLDRVALGAIGPITAATLRELNLRVAFAAEEYTAAGLVRALVRYFQNHLRLHR